MAFASMAAGQQLNFDDGSSNTVQIGTSYTKVADATGQGRVIRVLRVFNDDAAITITVSKDETNDFDLILFGESRTYVVDDNIVTLFLKGASGNAKYRSSASL